MLRFLLTFVFSVLLSFTVRADTLESVMMPGKVIQGHVKWEDSCEKCHKKFDKSGQNQLCKDCHKEVNQDIAAKKGYHGKLKESRSCVECHTEHKGRGANIAPINEQTFKHNQTDYELKGAHADAKTTCKGCHKPDVKYREAPSTCNACHKKDDKHEGTLGADCLSCHVEKDWKDTKDKFDHNKAKFALEGKHAGVKCNDCHTTKRYKEAASDCYSCHKKDDKHKGTLGQKCADCHNAKDWKDDSFNHDKTKFPLRGKHQPVKCESCHKPSATTMKIATSCVSCHKNDDKHEGTLGDRCEKCHVDRSWHNTPGFDHDKTKFPLLDKHNTAKCQACHVKNLTDKLPLVCSECHKKDDETKGHKGNFGTKCENCHTAKDWKTAYKFDHDRDTKYKLRDKHLTTKCVDCHKGKLYDQNLKTDCYACHKKDDDAKGHKGRYEQKCETCHVEKTWKTLIFDHDRDTKYKLLDKHRMTKCDSCHKTNLYKDKVKGNCVACHKSDDKHKNQLGDKCEDCHNAKSWKDAKFDHNKSKFPLLGKHYKVECKKCHLTPEFKDAKSECVSCHVKEDVHKQRLGTECEVCHNARDWKAWDFDHDRKTKFKLDGGHKGISCYECHRSPSKGKKLVTSVTCGDCHAADDVHDGGFGRQCERCHVSNNWSELKMGAQFSR